MRRPSKYKPEEVRALVEGYAIWRERKDTTSRGLTFLFRLADLDRAIKTLTPAEYRVVLVHGLLGHMFPDASVVLGITYQVLTRSYERGIRRMTNYLNGEPMTTTEGCSLGP